MKALDDHARRLSMAEAARLERDCSRAFLLTTPAFRHRLEIAYTDGTPGGDLACRFR